MSNEANISIDDARALVADEALWPRMRDFLWDFTPQIHASWLEGLRIPDGTAHSQRIKTYVLSSLGVAPVFHSFPKGDWSRLLLLDGATLEAIAKWLGAIVLADDLRRVMDGATVRALKASLSGVYPEVFGFTAYFKENDFQRRDAYPPAEGCPQSGCPSRGETQRLEDEVVSTGYNMLFSAIAGLPASLVSRLKLKLPKSLCDLCVSAPLRLKERSSQINLSAVLKLFKLKFPEAYKLCC